jgi:hypothetical protein
VDRLTADLLDWEDVRDKRTWSALLVGNGASIAIWPRFDYPSLFAIAQTLPMDVQLGPVEVELFERLGAESNFERALHDLLVAETVSEALGFGRESEVIADRYDRIRNSLIAAVHHVHIPFGMVPDSTLTHLMQCMAEYRAVFSLNYDLLLYWALMQKPERFTDCFNQGDFEPRFERDLWDRCHLYFVHGGIHLYRRVYGDVYKRHNEDGANLLSLFGQPIDGSPAIPLFVSEGTARQKRAAIADSPYLTFAYERLEACSSPVVVLGTSLGEPDRHIVGALSRHSYRPVAVGIYPKSDEEVVQTKAHFLATLQDQRLIFFDSRTHPLALLRLRIEPDP